MRNGHRFVWERGVVKWLRFVVALLSLMAASAWAVVPIGAQYRTLEGFVSPYFPSANQACEWLRVEMETSNPIYSRTFVGVIGLGTVGSSSYCRISATVKSTGASGGSQDFRLEISGGSCPANSTPVTGGCQCKTGFDESNGQCVPHVNKCTPQMNKPQTVNWTLGWTRTPDDTDSRWVGGQMSVPPSGGMACVEGCEVGINLTLSGPPQKSQVPAANGLYRVTAPFEALGRGNECTQNTKDSDKSTPIMPCPGYVGEIDGKAGCYGTAEKPVTTVDKPIPGGKAPIAGNPPAGTPASSGVGSTTGAGRTPTTGTGGNDGGPASAATGGKGGGGGGSASGTGSTTNGEGKEEKDPCGAPGQAVCSVKVDEEKTPKDGGDGMKTTALDQAMDKGVEGLQKAINPGGMDTSWGGIPSWFHSESCTPWVLGTFPFINQALTLNICEIQPVVIAVMTFLWVVGTFFAIVGMVGRVTGSGVH